MRQTISDIASLVQGDLVGDGTKIIEDIAPFDQANASSISILINARHSSRLDSISAAAVIVPLEIKKAPVPIIRVASPEQALVTILSTYILSPPPFESGIHPTASVHSTVTLPAHVSIGSHVTIGAHTIVDEHVCIGPGSSIGAHCRIGVGTWLYAHVILYDQVCLGQHVIIHSGTVVGSDGFGYIQGESGAVKIPQVGGVDIGDDVEIGANTTIDRATMGRTRIGRGSKIDNLVQIGHNVIIGDHVTICAQVGIAGSTVIEDGTLIAGQAGLADHIHVGAGARIGGQAGVTKSVPSGVSVSGYPARPHSHARRIEASVNRLPELMQRIQDMEQRLDALENP
ncbi:MAG: UDP-3-O-(3-hydroxymyristoyl)glucosamine N-acyltransferase [Gemmatimonadota bacterium]|nr:UDP-3-O-(3-hydroxymyristoyl)glucosamine N-acyltransferase [Gemmatimonadota bacterium]